MAVPDSMAAEFDVEFVDGDDLERRDRLSSAWNVRFESVSPVRKFGFRRGQRHFLDRWWLATTGQHVGFESWLERDHVVLLDFSPEVVGLASQPFWLRWSREDGSRRHAPDFFARRVDGTGVVIDVRADVRLQGAQPLPSPAPRRVHQAGVVVGGPLLPVRHHQSMDPQPSRRWVDHRRLDTPAQRPDAVR